MRDFDCRHMVVFPTFCIERSKVFSRQLHQAVELLPPEARPVDDVWAAHVDGRDMPRTKRNQLLATFSQPGDGVHRLLSNVKLLTEGVDVPGIDAITMIDNMRGPAQVIQIVGRACAVSGQDCRDDRVTGLGSRRTGCTRGALSKRASPDHEPARRRPRATDPDIERSVDELSGFRSTPTG